MTWPDLSQLYWREVKHQLGSGRIVYRNPPVFSSIEDAIAASDSDRRIAEWDMRHEVDYAAGEISALERWMRRPPLFFVLRIWEMMEFGYSGGQFPAGLGGGGLARPDRRWRLRTRGDHWAADPKGGTRWLIGGFRFTSRQCAPRLG
jgi:hypothetical protein